MFRKSAASKGFTPLSGKDVRALVDAALEQVPALEKKALKKAVGLHSKANVVKRKVGGDKVTVWEVMPEVEEGAEAVPTFGDDARGLPVFFSADGAETSRLAPTVFLLWKFPDMVPCVHTWGPVSEKVIQGADLMLPGVIVPEETKKLEEFGKGDVISIKVKGNPYPIAVGEAAVSSEEALASGLKGKGVVVFHVYGDELWKASGGAVPDSATFVGTRVEPMSAEALASWGGVKEALEEASEDKPDKAEKKKKKKSEAGSGAASKEEEDDAAAPEGAPAPAAPPAAAAPAPADDATAGDMSWTSDPNELIERTFVQALYHLKDDELPITTALFYADKMNSARPRGTPPLDVKETKFKKVSKLVQQMRKKGVIKTEEDGDVERITKVNRNDSTYRNHKKWEAEAGSGGDTKADGGGGVGGKAAGDKAGLDVVDAYAPSGEDARSILVGAEELDVKVNKGGLTLFAEAAVRSAFTSFCSREGLTRPGGKVACNKQLAMALFKQKKGSEEVAGEGEELAMVEALSMFKGQMQRYHVVTKTGKEPAVRKGEVKPVRVTLEQRQGGRKHLTHVVYLEKFFIDPREFADKGQRKFSTACSIADLPAKADAGLVEVLVQGDVCLLYTSDAADD